MPARSDTERAHLPSAKISIARPLLVYNFAMGMKTVTRHLAAWIACIAMLFAALAPSIALAIPVSTGEPVMQICSVDGMAEAAKLAKADAAASKSSAADPVHVKHCPLCVNHAGAMALPPATSISVVPAAAQASYPALFFQSPRPLAIWTAAQSRAPPVA